MYSIPIPKDQKPGTYWMRIRLDYAEDAGSNRQPWSDPKLDGPYGPALFGEVEDWSFTISQDKECNGCHATEIPECLENTPPGHNVRTSVSSNIEMMYDTVITCGTTRSSIVSYFEAIDNYEVYAIYDINTTSLYSGNMEIMVSYSNVPTGNDLRLLHYKGNWVDITTDIDTSSKTITGSIDSLSLFALVGRPQMIKGDTGILGLIVTMIILIIISILSVRKRILRK